MLRNYVKRYRLAARLTLDELSALSGVPVSTISDIERGAEPRVLTAIYLARALKTRVENLWRI